MSRWLVLFSISLALLGCSNLAPIKSDVSLPSQDLTLTAQRENESKVVLFNSSNKFLYGIDGSGRINIKLDGKGIGQLNIGQYLQIIVPKGKHQLELLHKDLFDFPSTHEIAIDNDTTYLECFATITANGVKQLEKLPTDFADKFKAAY